MFHLFAQDSRGRRRCDPVQLHWLSSYRGQWLTAARTPPRPRRAVKPRFARVLRPPRSRAVNDEDSLLSFLVRQQQLVCRQPLQLPIRHRCPGGLWRTPAAYRSSSTFFARRLSMTPHDLDRTTRGPSWRVRCGPLQSGSYALDPLGRKEVPCLLEKRHESCRAYAAQAIMLGSRGRTPTGRKGDDGSRGPGRRQARQLLRARLSDPAILISLRAPTVNNHARKL
jgi:hypothetical protein